ncbi:hypothetical protein L3Q82_007704 [Scortum barcoo]|uniref:Uncharacterized protein n=1 Tax=Scortum barcoo TaxID=214431 RepID=A0ACB8WPH7_9TELE|nr:hypothetical protein L3Q82_007704 [Scortum barcoo]
MSNPAPAVPPFSSYARTKWYCEITRSEFEADPNACGPPRTTETYDAAVADLQADNIQNVRGIKTKLQRTAHHHLWKPYLPNRCHRSLFHPGSSSSTSASSPGLDTQWDDNFEIPWSKFPEEVTHALERGKRPGPKLRRQMVRIVVTEMMEKCPHVGKKHSTDVARKMVAKYPNSLQDVIEGDIVGTGYHSLVKQLQNRIENVRRTSTPKIRKRKHQTDDSDHTDEIPLEERAAMQDIYGCIKWNVKFLPCEETQESQQQKMEKLKVMFQHSDANPEEVQCLMKSTFYTQRQHVNQGKSIKCLREEWPFCFDELGMSVHFKELTGIDLKETFIRNLDLKGKRLLNYMTTVCVNKSKKILQTYARLQRMRGQQSGCSDDVKEMILLLLSYFDEKEESMFFYVEDTCLAEEVQLEQVPLTPTIIVCDQFHREVTSPNPEGCETLVWLKFFTITIPGFVCPNDPRSYVSGAFQGWGSVRPAPGGQVFAHGTRNGDMGSNPVGSPPAERSMRGQCNVVWAVVAGGLNNPIPGPKLWQ